MFSKPINDKNKITTNDQIMKQSSTEIVGLVKSMITNQFKIRSREERATHYGIKCNEWKIDPIVGVRYKWAIWITWNLCELCEINNTHDHVFFKVKENQTRIPMLCEMKYMVKKIPPSKIIKHSNENSIYPSLSLDSGVGVPLKTHKDIIKANLVDIEDNDYLNRIIITEIEGEDKENKDLLIDTKWVLKNETEEDWPK